MAKMLIVANIKKILYPRALMMLGVTRETTKSIAKKQIVSAKAEVDWQKFTHTPEPLRSAGQRQAVDPSPRRENIGDINPWQRTPTH